MYVDCKKRTTAALGVGVETIEPEHYLLNHLVTSFVGQVERAASVGSRARIAVGNPDVVRLPASSISTGRRQAESHERFSEAGRWQAIIDTTTTESSLVDLKEKGATPQDRRFLYVDCIKRTTAALGVGAETIEPDHHLLNHLVTSFVAQVERGASIGSRVGIVVGNPDVVQLPASSRSTGRRQVGSHERFSEAGSRAHAQAGDG